MKNLLKYIRHKKRLKELKWFDLLILSAIFFGESIYTSTAQWISSLSAKTVDTDALTFSTYDNLWALSAQGKLLLIAIVYLLVRNYDFKQLKIKFKLSVLPQAIFIFIGSALLCDFTFTLISYFVSAYGINNYLSYLPYYEWNVNIFLSHFLVLDYSMLIYSLFNGFYEEFFFLGLLLSTDKKHRHLVLLFSTIIRTAFHTYQGIVPALVIGIPFGLYYYYLYTRKNDNLLPYFLGHALADMVGISFFSLFIAQ